jgi:hypothetical protein
MQDDPYADRKKLTFALAEDAAPLVSSLLDKITSALPV